jgi:hypothetical protein
MWTLQAHLRSGLTFYRCSMNEEKSICSIAHLRSNNSIPYHSESANMDDDIDHIYTLSVLQKILSVIFHDSSHVFSYFGSSSSSCASHWLQSVINYSWSVVQVVKHSRILDTTTTLKIHYFLEKKSSGLVWISVRAHIQTKAWEEFILEKLSAQETRLILGKTDFIRMIK